MKDRLKKLLPTAVRKWLERYIQKKRNSVLKKRILSNEEKLLDEDASFEKYIRYIRQENEVSVFNASFEKKYANVEVSVNNSGEYKYVVHFDKNVFFPKGFTESDVIDFYRNILMEQDTACPHRYLDEGEDLKNYIFFDLGSAEGGLPLQVIESLKHLYLFEGDTKWIGALKRTFRPWKDKTDIVSGYVGSKQGCISLKEYILKLKDEGVISKSDRLFIKMDIEGSEEDVMKDISGLLEEFDVRLAVCLYHRTDAEKKIKKCLPNTYKYRFRPGYMLFLYSGGLLEYPYFRHGVMRIERK